MNLLQPMSHFMRSLRNTASRATSITTLVVMLANLFTFLQPGVALASTMTSVTVALSNPGPSVLTNMQFNFTIPTSINGTSPVTCALSVCGSLLIDLPYVSSTAGTSNGFNPYFTTTTLATTNVTVTGGSLVAANYRVTFDKSNSSVTTTNRIRIDFVGTGAVTTTNAYTVLIAGLLVRTPAKVAAAGTADIYPISIFTTSSEGGLSTVVDTATANVAINDQIAASATFATALSLVVAGISSGSAITGPTAEVGTDYANITSSATGCTFSTIIPNRSYFCGFTLTVNTNGGTGYTTYIVQNRNMYSSGSGASISQFKNGGAWISTSATWTPPISNPSAGVYGHLGYSTNDTDINPMDSTSTWRGIVTQGDSTSQLDTNTFPSKVATNSTATVVAEVTTVKLRLQVTPSLPGSATAYTNTITFIAVANY